MTTSHILDDMVCVGRYDRSRMLHLIETFTDQCSIAAGIGRDIRLPRNFRARYKTIVFAGIGGSAIGADIARSYLLDESKIPLFLSRTYTVPYFVNTQSLVVALSYSGNTEETIASYKDARKKGARVIAITSGGALQDMAIHDGVPLISIPAGLPPRCALGYSFFPLLMLMVKLGIVSDKSEDIDQAVRCMEYLRDTKIGQSVCYESNLAKRLADLIYGKHPVIYSAQNHIDAAATRWRGQFAENAKTLASAHVFPEINHNEIMGWENPRRLIKDFIAVILRDAEDHPRVAEGIDITKRFLERIDVNIIEVFSLGDNLLARIFSLIHIGDFVSFYLAMLNKVDPTPIGRIDALKDALGKARKR